MNTDDRNLLFETYILHAELAERVAAAREGINKLHTSVVAGIVAASVLMHRLAPNTETLWVLSVLGMLVSVSWMFSIHSVTGRLTAKHKVLLILEKNLPFNFLDQESREFDKSSFIKKEVHRITDARSFSLNLLRLVYILAGSIWKLTAMRTVTA